MSIFDGFADIFTETLGEPVTYTHAGGEPVTINAFIETTAVIANFNGADTNASNVVAHVRASDVPLITQGDGLADATRNFKIVEPISADGRGMLSLTLELVAV
jgi:hypothetical protein